MTRGLVGLLLVAAACAACGDNARGDIAIISGGSAAWTPALVDFAEMIPTPASVAVTAVEDPASAATAGDAYGWRVVVVDDATIPLEGYALAHPQPRTLVARVHDLLGAQYAVAAALEDLGFRFRHPQETYEPLEPVLAASATAQLGVVQVPEIRVRGVQLHTLHPIEGYFALWQPSAANLFDAKQIVDWLVKNRGNYLQWPALNDILDPTVRAAWAAHERAILDYAHARGIRVGVGIEMFGSGNLQLALDLIDDTTGKVPFGRQIDARLRVALAGMPWDVVALSYGEFFDEPADQFIAANNTVVALVRAQAPHAEVHGEVHVGATQRVTYAGQDIPYYFLVKFADPSIIPDIHSVMYYDLFESAGGAYQQPNFDEHRQYIVDRMCANQKVAYFPELAYWVAFDDSVPTFLPLYVRSRWLDLDKLPGLAPAPCGKLDEHYVFSSGFEWGYWLQNVTALHDSYTHAASAQALIDDALAPDLGSDAAAIIGELADDQDAALITQQLAAYLAGRDAVIDSGRTLDIISQPDRVTFDQLPMMSGSDRDAFTASVIAPLAQHADDVDALAARFAALELPAGDSRWVRELRDGIDVDRTRAHFVVAAYDAVLAHLGGDDASAAMYRATAADLLARGTAIIHARHADLHDTHGTRLTGRTLNHTSYGYGYLYQADTVCYWNRELDQVDAALGNSDAVPPDCFL